MIRVSVRNGMITLSNNAGSPRWVRAPGQAQGDNPPMVAPVTRGSSSSNIPETAQSLLRKSGKIEPMLIDALNENPWQPRLSIAPNELEDLKKSIQDFGFIGYIPVRRGDPDDPTSPLEIVYGHRRVLAARLLGMDTVPIMLCQLDDSAMMRLAFVENSTQKKMTYWEEALHFKEMRDQLGLTVRKLAEMLGLSRNYVHSRLTLLNLPSGSPLRIAAERNDIAMANALVFTNLAKSLDDAQLDRLLADLRKGEISLDDLQALDRALVKAHELDAEALDDDGNAVRTVSIEDQRRIQEDLVEAARLKKLRPAPASAATVTRVDREVAMLEKRKATVEASASSSPASATVDAKAAGVAPATGTRPRNTTSTEPEDGPSDTEVPVGDEPRSTTRTIAQKDSLDNAREALEQLRGVIVHLRPRAEKADFSRLEPGERAELKSIRDEVLRMLAGA